jgi:hypothetical protein
MVLVGVSQRTRIAQVNCTEHLLSLVQDLLGTPTHHITAGGNVEVLTFWASWDMALKKKSFGQAGLRWLGQFFKRERPAKRPFFLTRF